MLSMIEASEAAFLHSALINNIMAFLEKLIWDSSYQSWSFTHTSASIFAQSKPYWMVHLLTSVCSGEE